MNKTTKIYVEYLYPGIIVSETSSKEVPGIDPKECSKEKGIIGFRFYEISSFVEEDEVYYSMPSHYTNWFFIGKRCSLDDIRKMNETSGCYSILIDNMVTNNYPYVCHTPNGQFLPMGPSDITMEEYEEIKQRKL